MIVIAILAVILPDLAGQLHRIEGMIQGLPGGLVYLSDYNNGKFQLTDSAEAMNGTFFFFRDTAAAPGMVRIDFTRPGTENGEEQSPYIEFIWAGESFVITADYTDIPGTVGFGDSEENRLLRLFLDYENTYQDRMAAVSGMLGSYPEPDSFCTHARNHARALQVAREAFILELARDNSDRYASRIVRAYLSPVVPASLTGKAWTGFMKEHYFERAPLNDPALLRAPVYGQRIIDYLRLYADRDHTFGEQEEAFMEAVDVIMANVGSDRELRSFVVEYLLDGFRSFGMERVETYIVDTYANETCTTDAVELARQRVEGYRKMAEGAVAADILCRDAGNRLVRLSEVESEYVLVLFWATHCEHCMEMIPSMLEWYMDERPENLEVFAVSIDTVGGAWETLMHTSRLPWINVREPLGWEGKSAADYNIYATPAMFLLDRERRIVARPFNLRELRREARRLQ